MAPIPPKIKKQEDNNLVEKKEIKALHEMDEEILKQIGRNKNTAKKEAEEAYEEAVNWVEEQDYLTDDDVDGFALESWVENNFLDIHALDGYAAESWVDENYLPRTGGVVKGDLHLKKTGQNYGSYIVFGDRPISGQDYAYIGENTDDHMTLYGKNGVLVQAGGNGGSAGRLILESLVEGNESGIDIACNGDSILNLQSTGSDYGRIELSTAHGVSMYSSNENTVITLQDWSSEGHTPHIDLRTKGGNIILNPSTGSTEVHNFVNMSDIRNKDIIDYVEYDIDVFADSPLFSYTLKNGDDKRKHIGTSAQYWQPIIPETVSRITDYDKDGKAVVGEHLALDYITVSYAGVVSLAREIRKLKEEIERLKNNQK